MNFDYYIYLFCSLNFQMVFKIFIKKLIPISLSFRCLSIELARGKKRVVTINLHPGTVNTNLTKPYHRGIPKEKLFEPEYSVEMLLKVIGNSSIENTGGFFAYDGEAIKW